MKIAITGAGKWRTYDYGTHLEQSPRYYVATTATSAVGSYD